MTTPAVETELGGILVPRRGEHAMVRGEGCWMWDDAGRRYLDLTSAYGTTPLGHCHPALVAALTEQAGRLQALSSNFFNDRRAELFAALDRHLPAPFCHYFLCNSGAEAIEACLKLACLASGRSRFVALKQGFHGRTLGALAVTWNPRFRKPFAALLQDVDFVAPGEPEELEAAIGDDTAAFIAEVVQGESGVLPVGDAYLRRAEELCRERGALFVVDEIQTGFGRTGAWFAHPGLGLEPDLMAMAKGIAGGLPMGAVAMTDRVKAVLRPGLHGSTFSGFPLACAASLATLEVLAAEDLPARAERMGEHLREELEARLAEIAVVREVRGRGLMIGIDLRTKVAPFLGRLMEEHGVVALPAGPTVLRLLPALVVTDEQIDLAVDAIAAVLGG
ncbi:MAG: aspartate aminotransferase family protein [Thermoanaerobaculia bacterium]|nr:aspartate aminotransferase family protein [Thermoanaerobaculia bacterium]